MLRSAESPRILVSFKADRLFLRISLPNDFPPEILIALHGPEIRMPGHISGHSLRSLLGRLKLLASASTLTAATTTPPPPAAITCRTSGARTASRVLPCRYRNPIGSIEVRLVLFIDLFRLVIVEVLSALNQDRALI
jgi:hypothetical protein